MGEGRQWAVASGHRATQSWLSLGSSCSKARSWVSGRQVRPRKFEDVHKTHLIQGPFWPLIHLCLFFFTTLLRVFCFLVFVSFFPSFSCLLLNRKSFLYFSPPPYRFLLFGSLENRLFLQWLPLNLYIIIWVYLSTHFSNRFKSHSISLPSSKTWHRL